MIVGTSSRLRLACDQGKSAPSRTKFRGRNRMDLSTVRNSEHVTGEPAYRTDCERKTRRRPKLAEGANVQRITRAAELPLRDHAPVMVMLAFRQRLGFLCLGMAPERGKSNRLP
ncbi:hypothetical protein [Ancylobacter sp. G4_0304]|uniref:hypothetical protein n=1 Tax=Ancylobacter sp. G4_0304 TaxID=3114289 RepID=UPI0039C5F99B